MAILNLTENSAIPSPPSSGVLQLYSLDDDTLWYQTPGGTSVQIGGAGSAAGSDMAVQYNSSGDFAGGDLFWDNSNLRLFSTSGTNLTVSAGDSNNSNPGGNLTLRAQNGTFSGQAGRVFIYGGNVNGTADNSLSGRIYIQGGNSGQTGTQTGRVEIYGGVCTDGDNQAYNGLVIIGSGQSISLTGSQGKLLRQVDIGTPSLYLHGNGSTDLSIQIANETNGAQGLATLSSGTVTVSHTGITANTRIFLTTQNVSGTPGFVYISARTPGVDFTITSSSASDDSDVAWLLVEPI